MRSLDAKIVDMTTASWDFWYGLLETYKANNDDPLIAPGNGQDGIDCWNNLAGIECSNSRNNINIKRYWHLTDDIITNY